MTSPLSKLCIKKRSKKQSKRAATSQSGPLSTVANSPDPPSTQSSLPSNENIPPSRESPPNRLPSEPIASSSLSLPQSVAGSSELPVLPPVHVQDSRQLRILKSPATEFFIWYSDLPSLMHDAQTKESFCSEFQRRTAQSAESLGLPGGFLKTLAGSLFFQVQRANAELTNGKTLSSRKALRGPASDAHTQGDVLEPSPNHSAKTTQAFLTQGLFALTLLDRILAALSDNDYLPALTVKPRLPSALHNAYESLKSVYKKTSNEKNSSRIARLDADRKHWRRITSQWDLPRLSQPSESERSYEVQSNVARLVNDFRTGISSMTAYSNIACAALSLNFWTCHETNTLDDWKLVFPAFSMEVYI